MTTAGVGNRIIDSVMPRYDAVLTEHVVVAADPKTVLDAARSMDLMTVRSPMVTVPMWIRGLPARWSGRAVSAPKRLVMGDGVLPGWVVLGETADEFAFGAVGRFWQPVIEWRDVARDDFAGFEEPGWGKIAADFTVRPYGGGSLLSYECRTMTTDRVSRRRFRRYWWLIRPFVAHIMHAAVRTAADSTQS